MTKSTHGGKRKGAGRAIEYDAARSIRLTAAQVEIARRLGDGDVSAGIRRALEIAAAKDSKINPK
jgi:hypothetical protein